MRTSQRRCFLSWILKGGIAFVRQTSCVVTEVKLLYCKCFLKYFATCISFLCNIIITLWVGTVIISILETEKWPGLESLIVYHGPYPRYQGRGGWGGGGDGSLNNYLLPTKMKLFLTVVVKYWTDTI